jgi:hypothetical protein
MRTIEASRHLVQVARARAQEDRSQVQFAQPTSRNRGFNDFSQDEEGECAYMA